MISADALTVEFGGTTLFKDISFIINENDRIALMGKNGAGKSTLLKILAGVREATRGKVSAPEGTIIAYLPQHLMVKDDKTVFEEAATAFSEINSMEARKIAVFRSIENKHVIARRPFGPTWQSQNALLRGKTREIGATSSQGRECF